MMKLMLLTADEESVKSAMQAGVDRIFLDLEYINKAERQAGRSTVISQNTIEDVRRVRPFVDEGKLLVRVNPIHANSQYEIDKVIEYGADIVMLPMFFDAADVRQFLSMVGGRAKTCLLIETAQAMVRLDDILAVEGVEEVYIGLNDLHISLGLNFMFEILSSGLLDYMTHKIKAAGIPFGFGGMGKIGEGMLPAESILAEHHRLGSSSVILSRTFRSEVGDNRQKIDLPLEIQKIRDKEQEYSRYSAEELEENRRFVKDCVDKILAGMRK